MLAHSDSEHKRSPTVHPLILGVLGLAGALLVALALLLFLQWPLRDGVQAYSRLSNDVAQVLFALYAAVAVTAASMTNSHLALAKPAQSAIKFIPSWRAWAAFACLAPWALLVLWTGVPQMLASIAGLERFSEGLSPGYFVLRIALVLLALLVLVQAAVQTGAGWRSNGPPP